MNIENQVSKLGWVLEEWRPPLQKSEWRARQRQFFTPWRETPEEVLADVKKLKEKPTIP